MVAKGGGSELVFITISQPMQFVNSLLTTSPSCDIVKTQGSVNEVILTESTPGRVRGCFLCDIPVTQRLSYLAPRCQLFPSALGQQPICHGVDHRYMKIAVVERPTYPFYVAVSLHQLHRIDLAQAMRPYHLWQAKRPGGAMHVRIYRLPCSMLFGV